MALGQAWIACMALATRFEEARRPLPPAAQEERPLVIRVAPPVADSAVPQSARVPVLPPLPPPPVAAETITPTPLVTPDVGDSRAKGLLEGARAARVGGDMGKAIVKLEEALSLTPNDPRLLYEMGMVHEQMGVFDKAASYYQRVFDMGVTGSGSLYAQAAKKLRDGFDTPDAMVGKLSLGRVQIFKDTRDPAQEKVVLTVPVQKNPSETIDPSSVSLEVRFFNRTNRGEIIPLEDQNKEWVAAPRWLDDSVDWEDGEESLRVVYSVPKKSSQDEHLFGTRSYYGQVVILQYGNQILDVQAWPRELAARINTPGAVPTAADDGPAPLFQDSLPDFDPAIPLLPSKKK